MPRHVSGRGGTARHLSDRDFHDGYAKAADGSLHLEARSVDGDHHLRRFDGQVPRPAARRGAPESGTEPDSLRSSAADESHVNGLWRSLSVHRRRAQAVADANQDAARLGHSLCLTHRSRRQRDQLLGRGDQAIHDRSQSRIAAPLQSHAP